MKKFVTIFNIYAPTAPTSSPENLVRYHTWLEELTKEVHAARASGCAIFVIGDFNVAPDPGMDRSSNSSGNKAAELLLWMQITSQLQMADAFRARHPNTSAMTHVRQDDHSRIDHILCNTDDFKLIKGIAIDSAPKIPNTAHRTIILDLDTKLINTTKKNSHHRAQTIQFPHHKRLHKS